MKNKFIKAAWLPIDSWGFLKSKKELGSFLNKLSMAGITRLFVLVQNSRGEVIYQKTKHPIIRRFAKLDKLETIISLAQSRSVEIRPWFMVFNQGLSRWAQNNPEVIDKDEFNNSFEVKDFSKRIISHGSKLLCPSQEKVQEWAFSFIEEVANNYKVQGIHLDYIRYGEFFGWCKFCNNSHFHATGLTLEETNKGSREWQCWIRSRVKNIDRFVKTVNSFTKGKGVDLSAAVFPRYQLCIESVGQDWVNWCQKGLLNFIVPMNYWGNFNKFNKYLSIHARALKAGIPILEGIGNSKSCSRNSVFKPIKNPETLLKRALEIKRRGFSGVAFFSTNGLGERELKLITDL